MTDDDIERMERSLHATIFEIRCQYERAVKPFYDKLAELHAMRTPRFTLLHSDYDGRVMISLPTIE